jgi:hypothetical protein
MDPLKSAWNDTPTPSRSLPELQAIVDRQTSPVMKEIKRQLVIEITGYALFLLIYYDFFDGDKKPLYLNALLVTAVLLLLVHNVTGYTLAKTPAAGNNLLESLRKQLRKIKKYAAISVTSRVFAFAGIFSFFLLNIQWNSHKYFALAAIAVLLPLQQYLLRKIWAGRIRRISGAVKELES